MTVCEASFQEVVRTPRGERQGLRLGECSGVPPPDCGRERGLYVGTCTEIRPLPLPLPNASHASSLDPSVDFSVGSSLAKIGTSVAIRGLFGALETSLCPLSLLGACSLLSPFSVFDSSIVSRAPLTWFVSAFVSPFVPLKELKNFPWVSGNRASLSSQLS